MIPMTSLQIISTFYKNTVVPRYKSLLAIFGLWATSQIILSLPVWIITKQTANKGLEMLLNTGIERISSGVPFFNSLTRDEFTMFIILFFSSLLIWILLSSFFENLIISYVFGDMGLKKALQTLSSNYIKLIIAKLILVLVLFSCLLIGYTIGLIVFLIAGLFVLLGAILMIYYYVRLSFVSFEIIINKTSIADALKESIQKTSKFSWAILFIIILTALCSSALNNLISNSMFAYEIVSTVMQVLTIILILPLFLEANKDAREDKQSNINS